MKDKVTRDSKGVAFVLFVDRDSAHKAVHAMNRKTLFGRNLKCSIASDNGRTAEFIKRRVYKDKSRCYECGEEGHVSYCCPKNSLGDRPQPEKKKKRRKGQKEGLGESSSANQRGGGGEEEEDEMEDDDLTLSDAIKMCHEVKEADHMISGDEPPLGEGSLACGSYEQARKAIKPHSYFSDEDASD